MACTPPSPASCPRFSFYSIPFLSHNIPSVCSKLKAQSLKLFTPFCFRLFAFSSLSAVTLHDYLYFLRTFVVLCRRELYIKNLTALNFLTILPRSRSGCKDAIIFNACQVLISLIFSLLFSWLIFKNGPLFLISGLQIYSVCVYLPKDFLKNTSSLL